MNQLITLTAVGDILLADEVIIRRGNTIVNKNCIVNDPFKYTKGLLNDSHITFGNLECPLCIHGIPQKDKDVIGRGHPQHVRDLVKAGFNVVSIANNHIMDYAPEGLFDTIEVLSSHRIKRIGAGENLKAAKRPAYFEVNGIRVVIMAYYGTTSTGKYVPGTAGGKFSVVKRDLAEVKRSVDIIVLSFHWGSEYLTTPPYIYVKFARQLIDAGAHVILGHHPHVLQGIERYRKGIIVYSLGNFVFDTSIHPVNIPETRESIILKCYLLKNGIQHYETIPIYINDRNQPEVLMGKDKEKVLVMIEELNKNLNNPEMLKHSDNRFIDAGIDFFLNRQFLHFLRFSWKDLRKYPLVYTLGIIKRLLKRIFKIQEQL